ncbi:MAG: hypothetical protein WC732_09960 [Candidatus Omnitrophota bacterium]
MTDDYWAWSRDYQGTHLARMCAVAGCVFALSGGTKRHYVGKMFGAMLTLVLAYLWHAFQEVSYLTFVEGSLAPPLIANYTPQSIAYEILIDTFAVSWALVTSIALRLPCVYNLEEEDLRTKGAPTTSHYSRWMRAGIAMLLGLVIYPLAFLAFGPLLQLTFVTAFGDASKSFRFDILIWTFFFAAWCGGFWFIVYAVNWKYGVAYLFTDVKLSAEEKKTSTSNTTRFIRSVRKRTLWMAGCHMVAVIACGLFCMLPYMNGLEFLQPVFGFAAAMCITAAVAIFAHFALKIPDTSEFAKKDN